jgi:hypothetical protein
MADSLAQQVDKYLKNNPDATNGDLYKKFPDMRKNTLRYYKSKFIKSNSPAQKKKATKSVKTKVASAKKTGLKAKTAKSKTTKSKTATGKKIAPEVSKKVLSFLSKNPKTTYEQLFAEFPTETKASLRLIKQKFKQRRAAKNRKNLPSEVSRREKEALTATNKGLSKVHQVSTILADATKKIQNPLIKTFSSKKVGAEKIKKIEEQLLEFGQKKEKRLLKFAQDKRAKLGKELSKFEELQCVVAEKIAGFISVYSDKKKG